MNLIDINQFIKNKVLERQVSLFQSDIEKNRAELHEAIFGKSVLVIGGAGTIGSSYIKAILEFKPPLPNTAKERTG